MILRCPFSKEPCIQAQCAIYNDNAKTCSLKATGETTVVVKPLATHGWRQLMGKE